MKLPLLLFASAVIAAAQPPPEAALKRAEALVSETIPHLTLKEATFEEALSAVQRAWSERHPNDPLPIALTDFAQPDGYRAEYGPRITLDFRNVPFIEALLYIGQAGCRRFSAERGLPQYERIHWIEEGWETRVHDLPANALSTLGLYAESSPEEIQQALRKFGVELEDWMKPRLTASGHRIVLHSYPTQQEQIAGIFSLLRAGFKITK